MFCQASMKVKLSRLSVLCYMTFMLVVNKNALLAFHSVCHVLFRDKTRSLGNKMTVERSKRRSYLLSLVSVTK